MLRLMMMIIMWDMARFSARLFSALVCRCVFLHSSLVWSHTGSITMRMSQISQTSCSVWPLGVIWGGVWWARRNPESRSHLEVFVQVFQPVEDAMLHHRQHTVWYLHRLLLGMLLRLYRLHPHLGVYPPDTSIWGQRQDHRQGVCSHYPHLLRPIVWSLRKAIWSIQKIKKSKIVNSQIIKDHYQSSQTGWFNVNVWLK